MIGPIGWRTKFSTVGIWLVTDHPAREGGEDRGEGRRLRPLPSSSRWPRWRRRASRFEASSPGSPGCAYLSWRDADSAGLPPPPVQGRRASAAGLTTAIQGRAPWRRAASAARLESGHGGPEIPCETRPEGATPRSTAGISRSPGECWLGIGLAPGETANVYVVAPSVNGATAAAVSESCAWRVDLKGCWNVSHRRRVVFRQHAIRFAMSACHETRRQVVEQGLRSPARAAPHWEQAVGRAFLRPGWISRHRIGPS